MAPKGQNRKTCTVAANEKPAGKKSSKEPSLVQSIFTQKGNKKRKAYERPIVDNQQQPTKRVRITDKKISSTNYTDTNAFTINSTKELPPNEFHSILSLYYNSTSGYHLLKLKDYLQHILQYDITLQKDFISRRALRKSIRKLDKVVETATPTDALKFLLETTLVAFRPNILNDEPANERAKITIEESFLGSIGESTSIANLSIEELVDYATKMLNAHASMDRNTGGWEAWKRRNVLLRGYGTSRGSWNKRGDGSIGGMAWDRLVKVVGNAVVWWLLVRTAVFVSVDEGGKDFVQICGVPILESAGPWEGGNEVMNKPAMVKSKKSHMNRKMVGKRTPNQIAFVRNRMYFGVPSLAKGRKIKQGLKSYHVLNRFNEADNRTHVVHVMKYIFPWQFSLHNVFCSDVNKFKTTHPFMDYTYRPEIDSKTGTDNFPMKREIIPKRLRKAESLVGTMIRRNQKIKYGLLLKHHCFSKLLDEESTKSLLMDSKHKPNSSHSTSSLIKYSTPYPQVIKYILSIVQHLMPLGFFGTLHNLREIQKAIGRFIYLRKFETMTLHTFSQKVNIRSIAWLGPSTEKMSCPDTEKRRELLLEFLYWLMDSIVIPLIANTFYVTDISDNTNKTLLYFRQDVWRQLMTSIKTELKVSMFAPLSLSDDLLYGINGSKISKTPKYLPPKSLIPYSTFRILPKPGMGYRIITNMGRRATQANGQLGPAPNMILKPVLAILRYYRDKNKKFLMGSSMESPSDFQPRVAEFKKRLKQKGLWKKEKLYFVKLDIQKCFDTIPAEKLLEYLEDILGFSQNAQEDGTSVKAFQMHNYTKITPGGPTECIKKFTSYVKPVSAGTSFIDDIKKLAKEREAMIAASITKQKRSHAGQLRTPASKVLKRKNSAVYVGNAQKNGSKVYQLETVYGILKEHLTQHIVKIGSKYYRQKKGIPQGSILSSLLVNMFYAKMEREELGFVEGQQKSQPLSFSEKSIQGKTQDSAQEDVEDKLQDKTHKKGESLLTRYVDDFLLITTSLPIAKNFLKILLPGLPDYGAAIHPKKALTNFSNTYDIPVNPTQFFPFIGLDISTSDLSINVTHRFNLFTQTITTSKSKMTLSNSHPLSLLPQKLLKGFAFKYLDSRFTNTVLNSSKTIRRNIEEMWKDLARQVRAYVSALIPGYRKCTGLERFEKKRKVEKLLAEILRGGIQVLRNKVKGDRAWVGRLGEKVLRRIVLGERGACEGKKKGKWTFRDRNVKGCN